MNKIITALRFIPPVLCLVFASCPKSIDEGSDNSIKPPDDPPGVKVESWWDDFTESGARIETDFAALTGSGGFQVTINPNVAYQAITQGFGASDCWSGNFVGQWRDPADAAKPHPNVIQICDWLFSRDFDAEGNPLGIGLSQWRINLGGGSWEQGVSGTNPKIGTNVNNSSVFPPNYTRMSASWERRAESYLADINNPSNAAANPLSNDPDINPLARGRTDTLAYLGMPATNIEKNPYSGLVYDWSKCAGQQLFMIEAKKRGLELLIAFSNSPVVCWTLSGTANNAAIGSTLGSGGDSNRYTKYNTTGNLKDNAYAVFADYLADISEHFAGVKITDKWARQQNLGFNYISPVNEPQWDWNEDKQEGSQWNNANIAKLARAMNSAFNDPDRPLISNGGNQKTKIMITEAAQWNHLTEGSVTGNTAQIDAFWNPKNSATYLGNLPGMNNPKMITAHTYFTHSTDNDMRSIRTALKNKADQFEVEIHQTEWCGLGGGGGISDINTYYDCALFMAKLIYADFTIENAMSWAFWTALDMERGGKSRYSLIGYTPGTATYTLNSYQTNPLTSPGAVQSQPTLWTLGNYSLFIRPGFRRISLTGEGVTVNNTSGLMGSAYISPPDYKEPDGTELKRIVAVYVNMNSAGYQLAAKFTDDFRPAKVRCYLTSQNLTGEGTGGAGMRYQGSNTNGVFSIPARSVLTVVYDF